MERACIKIIPSFVFALFFFGLALGFTSKVFAQLPLLPPSPPKGLEINTLYYEPTEDYSVSVYLDGKLKEWDSSIDILPGRHTVKCVKNGYFDFEGEIDYPQVSNFQCKMAKTTPMTVKVKDTLGNRVLANVYIDDESKGGMDVGTFTVAKGTHTVKCVSEGYEDFVASVEAAKYVEMRQGTFYNVDCILKPLPGTYIPGPTPTPIPKPKNFWGGFLTWLVGILSGIFK